MTITNPIPARRPVAPHIVLSEMMDAEGMTCEQLAEKSLLMFDVCQAILLGTQKIDRARAMGLSLAFATSVEFWTNLQGNHDNWKA